MYDQKMNNSVFPWSVEEISESRSSWGCRSVNNLDVFTVTGMPYCPEGTFAPSLPSIRKSDTTSERFACGIVSNLYLLMVSHWASGIMTPMMCDTVIISGSEGEGAHRCTYFEFICVIEADLYGRHHPRLEQSAEDLIGHRVGDEMKV